jgi:hypothetical protein
MPSYDELLQNLSKVAADDLKPLIASGADALGVDEAALGGLLSEAWMLGAHAGQVEIVAQADEYAEQHGIEMEFTMLRAESDDSV